MDLTSPKPKTSRRAVARPKIRPVDARMGVPLVQQAVEALRRAILGASGAGVFLGSEAELIEALGVSRPTFRQAAKLLKHENLLDIKRGKGGGFFTCAPSVAVVSRMAAIYLNAQGTSMRQINDVVAPLQLEAALVLASHPDLSVRSRLMDFVVSQGELNRSNVLGSAEAGRRMMAFNRLLTESTGNPAMALVMAVILDLARDARRASPLLKRESVDAYARFQMQLAQAIFEGDARLTETICNRHRDDVRKWLPDEPLALSMMDIASSSKVR